MAGIMRSISPSRSFGHLTCFLPFLGLLFPLFASAVNLPASIQATSQWSCEDLLSINVQYENSLSSCGAFSCANNVLKILDGLPDPIQKETRILLIAPLDSANGLTPRQSRFGKAFWTFHAVLIYKGRVIDPAFPQVGLPLSEYLNQMFFDKELAQSAIWTFTRDQYSASVEQSGWLFIFKDLLQSKPDLFVAQLLIGYEMPKPEPSVHLREFKNLKPGASVQVRHWITPNQDLKDSYIECHEGHLDSANGRSIVVRQRNGKVEIPIEAVQSLRVEDQYKPNPLFSHWWKMSPASESPCVH